MSLTKRVAGMILMACGVISSALAQPLVELVKTTTGSTVQFAEFCCSPTSVMTEMAVKMGLTTHRFSHYNGFDFHTKLGFENGLRKVKQTRPRKAWVSTPCKYYSQMQNANQRTKKQVDNLRRNRQRANIFNMRVAKIALTVIHYGGHVYWEWPL